MNRWNAVWCVRDLQASWGGQPRSGSLEPESLTCDVLWGIAVVELIPRASMDDDATSGRPSPLDLAYRQRGRESTWSNMEIWHGMDSRWC